ncbi:MAG: hypothetical protein JNK15_17735 [Planctomycetes bacterium]|nr:hypothetical protein [Planctomycetota bacterium]
MNAMAERTCAASPHRLPGTFFGKAAAIGLGACALLISPLCLDTRFLNVWFAAVFVAASILAAWSLVAVLRRPRRVWIVVGGLGLPLVAAAYFGFAWMFVERYFDGRLPLTAAFLEGIAGAAFGPLVCVRFGFVTFPIGLVGAWWLRRDLVAPGHDA